MILSVDGSIHKIPEEWKKAIGTIIIDEAHQFGTQARIDKLMSFQPEYIIAETATFKRDDGMEEAVKAICGMNIISKKSKKPFNVIKYKTGIKIQMPKNYKGDLVWSKYVKILCFHNERNQQILNIVSHYSSAKILILTRRTDHVDYLYNLLKDHIPTDYMCGTKKTYNNSRVLIGTTDKIGTGFDEETLCNDFDGIRMDLLILAMTIKSDILLEQVSGRVFRAEFPWIVYLIDDNKLSENHWKVGKKWFESRNGTIIEYDAKNNNTTNTTNTTNTNNNNNDKVDIFEYAKSFT